MGVFGKSRFPGAVCQSSLQVRSAQTIYNRLVEGVVLDVYHVDSPKNMSRSNAKAVYGTGAELVAGRVAGEAPPLNPPTVGFRTECTVLIVSSMSANNFQIVSNVRLMGEGGYYDYDGWVPRPAKNFIKGNPNFDLNKLDGDRVLLGFIGGSFPNGGIILGKLSHPSNYLDSARSVQGSWDIRKNLAPEDTYRRDGNNRMQRVNGAIKMIDRHGNIEFNTVEANRSELPGAMVTGIREFIPSVTEGDCTFKIKDGRNFRVEFQNNISVPIKGYDLANPREFPETGYIEVRKGIAGVRIIDIEADGEVVINVKNTTGGTGKFTVNTPGVPLDGIVLGDSALTDRFATKEFVENIFSVHNHIAPTGPTSPPLVGGGPVLPVAIDGTIVTPTGIVKATTSKVAGE